jgi:hypothetical protein
LISNNFDVTLLNDVNKMIHFILSLFSK